ncbi:DNA-binding protein [Komagataeibacter melaceti]|uniref:DNA-binding protein n=2 Tax=Komagataeibacter melaceti TaxID=2766577 RepID=A0A371YZ29_9PROT|nr:DNA-binding protein [Komagataeibacter melaceti]
MNRTASPISASIQDAVKMSGIGRTTLYGLLSQGKIKARKCGRRTLIMVDSLESYINSLPYHQPDGRQVSD